MMTSVASSVGPDARDLMEGRGVDMYSPAASTHSQYSTYSREVKYIFNPIGGNNNNNDSRYIDDEYSDYSHIVPKDKQHLQHHLQQHQQLSPHLLAHTPHSHSHSRTHTPQGAGGGGGGGGGHHTPNANMTPCNLSVLSLSSSVRGSGCHDNGPMNPRDDFLLRSHSRTSSVLSTQSRDRNPISPSSSLTSAPEAVYAGTRSFSQGHHRGSSSGSSSYDGVGVGTVMLREKNHHNFSPIRETPPPSYQHAKNYSSFKFTPGQNHGGYSNWPPNSGSSTNKQGAPDPPLRRQSVDPSNSNNNFAHQQPPYPAPPRYSRRKTWSPPILKLNSQDARVCLSNDSLDHSSADVNARTAQRSYSDDLDSTPPRLAPISGVLAQKPGPNLVRPIAFKPIHATSPNHHGGGSRHPSGGDPPGVNSPDLARPLAVKLGTGLLGHHRSSPDKPGSSGRHQHQQQHPSHKPSSHLHGPDMPSSHHGAASGNFRSPNANASYHNHNISNISNNSSHLNNNTSASSHSHHNMSSTSSHLSLLATPHHHSSLNPYNLNSSGGSHHNSSAASSHMSCAEDSFSADMPRPSDRADSVNSVPTIVASTRGWHQTSEGMLQTPSPSDSGVGELEAILREKDAEINTLREVMDRNERAILQVYEERKNAWAQDAHELRDDYERKLKVQSRKSYKTEQVLSLQVYKLQQEQKTMNEEKEKAANERESLKNELEAAMTEISNLRDKLKTKEVEQEFDNQGLPEEVALKNKEIITLRSELHSVQSEIENKNKEILEKVRELLSKKEEAEKLRSEVERLKNPLELKEASSQTHAISEISNSENVKPSMMGEREKIIQGLQDELLELRNEVLALKDEHDRERDQWLDEKNKVVRYQKQLQLNYVQMQRKNTSLETEVQQLTLELENRDMKLIAMSGEESVC